MGWFKRRPIIDVAEIHAYIDEIQRVTLLRDKARNTRDIQEYDEALHIMRLVLVRLNELKH